MADSEMNEMDVPGRADARDVGEVFAPRIAVECFCATPDFATVLQEAARDRRMHKARMAVAMGGPGQAAKRFANFGTPNLLIVETLESGYGVFQELEALAEVCDPDTQVIVAGPSNDITLYRELLRQGVSEYLVSPSAPLQVIDAVTGLYVEPEATPAARTVAVFGVKGGVGSSVLAHNLADLIGQELEKDTLLVDFDLAFGTASLDFNLEPKHSVAEAIADLSALDDMKLARLVQPFSDHLKILSAPGVARETAAASSEAAELLIDIARTTCDALVLDLPKAWDGAVRQSLLAADEVVLVAAPDLASLRNVKAVHGWLSSQRQNDSSPKVVLTQTGMPKRPEIDRADFTSILGAPIDLEIPFEPALFGAALNNGTMLSEMKDGAKVAAPLRAFARKLMGREAIADAGPKSALHLGGLLKVFKRAG
ncbi:MAG: AAA family ATPase [Pseudomonadota bacterium]